MEGSAHLPHYSQSGRQSAPLLAMHPGQIIDSVFFLGSENNNAPAAQCREFALEQVVLLSKQLLPLRY